jgi:hypothetical protein
MFEDKPVNLDLERRTINDFFNQRVDLALADTLRKAQPHYCGILEALGTKDQKEGDKRAASGIAEGCIDILAACIMHAHKKRGRLPYVSEEIRKECVRISNRKDPQEIDAFVTKVMGATPNFDYFAKRKMSEVRGEERGYGAQYKTGVIVGLWMLETARQEECKSKR